MARTETSIQKSTQTRRTPRRNRHLEKKIVCFSRHTCLKHCCVWFTTVVFNINYSEITLQILWGSSYCLTLVTLTINIQRYWLKQRKYRKCLGAAMSLPITSIIAYTLIGDPYVENQRLSCLKHIVIYLRLCNIWSSVCVIQHIIFNVLFVTLYRAIHAIHK